MVVIMLIGTVMPLFAKTAVFIPITFPEASSRGTPEYPRFSRTSVIIRLSDHGPSIFPTAFVILPDDSLT